MTSLLFLLLYGPLSRLLGPWYRLLLPGGPLEPDLPGRHLHGEFICLLSRTTFI